MPDTENCGRIPRKIPKTWSAEVVVGEGGKVLVRDKVEDFFVALDRVLVGVG